MQLDKEYQRFVSEFERNFSRENNNIVFLCIGSNKVIGDCFGPMVGTNLKRINFRKNIKVIGDMDKPINAINVKEKIKNIDKNSYIIAIDSALSKYEADGIYVNSKKMILGNGVNKNIIEIGDMSIKGCIGKMEKSMIDNLYNLNEVYKNKIYMLSNIVTMGIYEILKIGI